MLYSAIYTIDTPHNERIVPFYPPQYDRHRPDEGPWHVTEGDEEYQYGHLGWPWEGIGHHRKFCALLTQEEFDEFIREVCIYAEDVETGGSLGAPGFGFGWAPAISFSDYDRPGAILNAYVSPIPGHMDGDEIVPDEGVELPLTDEDWEVIRRELIDEYS